MQFACKHAPLGRWGGQWRRFLYRNLRRRFALIVANWQHRATRFVLNKPWRRNHRDSITVHWTGHHLRNVEDTSVLMLLFKQDNPYSLSVFASTISFNHYHNQKLMRLYHYTLFYQGQFQIGTTYILKI